jgi:hypothetical protein
MHGLRQIYGFSRIFGCTAALLALSAVMATAQQTSKAAAADAHYSGGEIYFQANVRASAWSLTLTGPDGFVLIRRSQGSPPSISVFDQDGNALPDGAYSYELQGEISRSGSAFETSDEETAEGRKMSLRSGVRPVELPALSGHFRIANGAIVTPEGDEPRTSTGTLTRRTTMAAPDQAVITNDQVILDDLIVVGSGCIGQDCVNNENFGFDTIRMKENNLRIKAQDTSNSGSFPTNDWQITFNDSANGGLNKFSIDDIDGGRTPFTIEAGAPSHSLYVDDGGLVGLGTSTPVVELHVKDGDTPTLRLEQDGSSGFTPQTWDVAGNETNFFVRDVTNGSTLPIRLRPGAPSSSIEVASNGNVGIGSAPDATSVFHVKRTGNVLPVFESSNGNAVQFRIKSDSANRRIVALDGSDNQQSQIVLANNGHFEFLGPSVGDVRATLDATGLDVNGTIKLNGTQIHPDYVFEPQYDLLSIDQQAAFMWEHRHLPAVGPGIYDSEGKSVLDLGRKTMGMLEELEKAHIYIEQLNNELRDRSAQLQALQARLERLEHLLGAEE